MPSSISISIWSTRRPPVSVRSISSGVPLEASLRRTQLLERWSAENQASSTGRNTACREPPRRLLADGAASHSKYIMGEAVVYRDVYRVLRSLI